MGADDLWKYEGEGRVHQGWEEDKRGNVNELTQMGAMGSFSQDPLSKCVKRTSEPSWRLGSRGPLATDPLPATVEGYPQVVAASR